MDGLRARNSVSKGGFCVILPVARDELCSSSCLPTSETQFLKLKKLEKGFFKKKGEHDRFIFRQRQDQKFVSNVELNLLCGDQEGCGLFNRLVAIGLVLSMSVKAFCPSSLFCANFLGHPHWERCPRQVEYLLLHRS